MSNPTLDFKVSDDDVNGLSVERLDIEARTVLGRLTKLTLWEDGRSWVYSRERGNKNQKQPALTLDIHATLVGMEADDVAGLLRMTLDDPQLAEKEWRSRANKIE